MNIKKFLDKKYLLQLKEFTQLTHERFKNERITRISASLSYTSLIALIPLLTIGLGVFAAFPVFAEIRSDLQNFIFNQLFPAGLDSNIELKILSFVSSTKKLPIFGFIGLVISSILLLNTIESAFNVIFKVRKPRPLIIRVLVYWTSCTMGPILLGLALSISIKKVFLFADIFATLITMISILTFMYMVIPNTIIKFKNAFIGALFSSLTFIVLKKLFAIYYSNGSVYHSLYGTLAVLPLFLVWMYLSWLIILIGAIITVTLEEKRSLKI